MKKLLAISIMNIGALSTVFASFPAAGWKGPFNVRGSSSQVSVANGVYSWNFYINGAAESGSWCGSDSPIVFNYSGNSNDANLASTKAAQASVLSALSMGSSIKVRFKGSSCLVDDVMICADGANCNPQ